MYRGQPVKHVPPILQAECDAVGVGARGDGVGGHSGGGGPEEDEAAAAGAAGDDAAAAGEGDAPPPPKRRVTVVTSGGNPVRPTMMMGLTVRLGAAQVDFIVVTWHMRIASRNR